MKTRWYSFEFKKAAVERARAAPSIPALSKELGVHFCQVYRWLRIYEEQGEEALQTRGRQGRPGRSSEAPERTDPLIERPNSKSLAKIRICSVGRVSSKL